MSVIRLNLNENPRFSKGAVRALDRAEIHRYPESDCTEVRRALSREHGLHEDQFFVAPGSDSILFLIAQAWLGPRTSAVVPVPSYSGFHEAAAGSGACARPWHLTSDHQYDLAALKHLLRELPQVVFLCHPNNPTGTCLAPTELNATLDMCVGAGSLVVVDEAYAEYAEGHGHGSALTHVVAGSRVLVLRTFSKFYGLAGLRIGYAAGCASLIAKLQAHARPFRVNTAAQHAALSVLNDRSFRENTRAEADAARRRLLDLLEQAGYRTLAGPTNFVLVDVDDGRACAEFLDRHGIAVLPMSDPSLASFIRISLGAEEEMVAVARALTERWRPHGTTARIGTNVQ